VRTTIAEMGPLLLARLMDASEPQEGVINIAFKIADKGGLPLLDLKDFSSLLNYMGENATELSSQYGLISKASVGSIQRALLVLEQQGAEHFFGEPALKITDIMRKDNRGYGQISVLAADKLMMNPRLYATFLLWLLSELFEELPEVGDPAEAEAGVLLRRSASAVQRRAEGADSSAIEQVVRLIRSKGVGVYFVTQNPLDVPIAYWPARQPGAACAARLYAARAEGGKDGRRHVPPQPCLRLRHRDHHARHRRGAGLDAEAKGAPSIVERTLIRPPSGRVGPLTDAERQD
jgi:DNA helicase HerA-like ATPase